MAKLSSQIYADIQAIKEDGRQQLTTNLLLSEVCNALVNVATALENINSNVAGPENPITAAELDTAVEAIDVTDSDPIMTNRYLKVMGLLATKIAMEEESIDDSYGAQAKRTELSTSFSLIPTIDVDALSEHVYNATMALGASIDIDSQQEVVLSASLGVEAQLYQAIVV